jgi:hypothetical protein
LLNATIQTQSDEQLAEDVRRAKQKMAMRTASKLNEKSSPVARASAEQVVKQPLRRAFSLADLCRAVAKAELQALVAEAGGAIENEAQRAVDDENDEGVLEAACLLGELQHSAVLSTPIQQSASALAPAMEKASASTPALDAAFVARWCKDVPDKFNRSSISGCSTAASLRSGSGAPSVASVDVTWQSGLRQSGPARPRSAGAWRPVPDGGQKQEATQEGKRQIAKSSLTAELARSKHAPEVACVRRRPMSAVARLRAATSEVASALQAAAADAKVQRAMTVPNSPAQAACGAAHQLVRGIKNRPSSAGPGSHSMLAKTL